ncbi:MAG: hypothetical protein JNM03_15580 [Sphingopyxis sp.]|uniref:hypothetical protein n=1 Tax=Sphingopyxis sp. TaxID=1908224 RepID=UPI001A4AC486|nr:hypothetical protein [Sphingopyxis sp.]MBL9071403.1 hypothetical protein [Sphingopyxis sp.]
MTLRLFHHDPPTPFAVVLAEGFPSGGKLCNFISQNEAAMQQEVKSLNDMAGICDMDGTMTQG